MELSNEKLPEVRNSRGIQPVYHRLGHIPDISDLGCLKGIEDDGGLAL